MIQKKTPYNLPMVEDCSTCELRKSGTFCDMSGPSRDLWSSVRRSGFYPRGALLFVQGQEQKDVCVICVGRVKLYSTAPNGESIIHRVCQAGEVLGLSGAFHGQAEANAETMEPCVVSYVSSAELQRLMRTDPDVAVRVARHLSHEVSAAWSHLESLGTHSSAIERLAGFLSAAAPDTGTISMNLTHKEIAETIGVTRETVTRAFSDLKKRKVIRVRGHVITVTDREVLRRLAGLATA